jgi:hypothetical protein
MADPTSVEDLYETILGRASDAGGLQYWQGLQAGGMSLAAISNEFLHSEEYQASHPGRTGEPAAVTGQTYGDNRTTLLGKDISDMRWDDLVADIQTDKLQRAQRSDSYDAYSGNAYSALLGTEVQQYVAQGTGRDPQTGFYKKDAGPDPWAASSISSVNLKDTISGREGYMTQLVRGDDGSVRVKEYEEKNGFLRDMITFVAIAATMGAAITALGGNAVAGAAGSSASAEGATAAAGSAAEVSTISSDLSAALTSDFPGVSSFSPGSVGTGFQPIGTSGFQAIGSSGFTASVGTPGLGSLAPGFFAGETLGGLTALVPDVLAAGTGYLGTLGPGSFSGEVLGGLNPLVPKALTPDVEHLGSLGEGYFKGETITPGTAGGDNWWEKIVNPIKGVADGLGVKDLITGIGAIGAIAGAVDGSNGNKGSNASGPTINFPEIKQREPGSGALALTPSQRAGVRFGQTKSKRELRGKFSGTGIRIH